MILVAGLAIAGLAGIAAAFYFSVRPGNSSSSPVRNARSGRTGTGRAPALSRTSAPPSRPSRSGPTAGRSRLDPDADFDAPPRRHSDVRHLTAGRRGGSPGPGTDHTVPVGVRAAGAGSRPRPAERPELEADTAEDAVRATRARRRVGFRKGSEVDEELWPSEAFGGVSDEQFWDDMASDKPLATTARTAAQADPGARRRLPEVAPVPNGRGVDDRVRLDGSRMIGGGSGSYSPTGRTGSADRTVIQPVQTSPQRTQTGPQLPPAGPQPLATGPQPVPAAARSYQPGTQPLPYQGAAQSHQGAAQSYQPPTQPAPVMGQGARAALQADPRGRARHGNDAGAGEDPLTSAAYSLRAPGAVDGRSYQSPRRSRELTREQYEAAVTQETQSFSLADGQAATGGYPSGVPPFRQYELPAGGGPSGPNSLSGQNGSNGNGRSDVARYDGLRSDPLRSDAFRSDPLRSDPLRSDPLRSDAYWSGGRADPLRTAGTSDAYGYPYPERPYSDPAPSAGTPPYGEMYGYGYPASPADDPRQPNGTRGTRGQGRSSQNGDGTDRWGARPAHPAGNGYRGSYDPRANGRG